LELGADHPSTLTSMDTLASTFWNQGRLEEAEELFVQVMETRKKKPGADHPSTLTSMNNLRQRILGADMHISFLPQIGWRDGRLRAQALISQAE
jgi:hypothetical protein